MRRLLLLAALLSPSAYAGTLTLLMCGPDFFVKCPAVQGPLAFSNETNTGVDVTHDFDIAPDADSVIFYQIGPGAALSDAETIELNATGSCNTAVCTIGGLQSGVTYTYAAVMRDSFRYSNVQTGTFTTTGSLPPPPSLTPAELTANTTGSPSTAVLDVLQLSRHPTYPAIPGLTAAQQAEVDTTGFVKLEWYTAIPDDGTGTPTTNLENFNNAYYDTYEGNAQLDAGSGGNYLFDGQMEVFSVRNENCGESGVKANLPGSLTGDPDNKPTFTLVDAPTTLSGAWANTGADHPVAFFNKYNSEGLPGRNDGVGNDGTECGIGGKTALLNGNTERTNGSNGYRSYVRSIRIDLGSGAGGTKANTYAFSHTTAQNSMVGDIEIVVDQAGGAMGRLPGRGGLSIDMHVTGSATWCYNDYFSPAPGAGSGHSGNTLVDSSCKGAFGDGAGVGGVLTENSRVTLVVDGFEVEQDLSVGPLVNTFMGTAGTLGTATPSTQRSSHGSVMLSNVWLKASGAAAPNPFPVIENATRRTVGAFELYMEGLKVGDDWSETSIENQTITAATMYVPEYVFATDDTTVIQADQASETGKTQYNRVEARNYVDGANAGRATLFTDGGAVTAPANIRTGSGLSGLGIDYPYYAASDVINVVTQCPNINHRGASDATAGLQACLDTWRPLGYTEFFLPKGVYEVNCLTLPSDVRLFGASAALTKIVVADAAACSQSHWLVTESDINGKAQLWDFELWHCAQSGCGRTDQPAIYWDQGKGAIVNVRLEEQGDDDFAGSNIVIGPNGGGFYAASGLLPTKQGRNHAVEHVPFEIANTNGSPFRAVFNMEHNDENRRTLWLNGASNVTFINNKTENRSGQTLMDNSDNIVGLAYNDIGSTAWRARFNPVNAITDSSNYAWYGNNAYKFAPVANNPTSAGPVPIFRETVGGVVVLEDLLSAGPLNYPAIKRGSVNAAALRFTP